jgi:metallo-beta-lactamase class B
MPLNDNGVPHRVMFFCSISASSYPLAGKDAMPGLVDTFRASFARLKTMKADVFLAPHGGQFHLAEKLAKLKPGAPNPFIDAGELHSFTAQAEKDFDAELAKQKAAEKP